MVKIMKKYSVIIIIWGIIFAIIGYGFIKISAGIINNTKGIGINLPKDSIITVKEDNHGGFHGDGEYYSEIQLTNDGVKEFINNANKTGEWLSLPLPKDIQLILHGGKYDDKNYHIGKKSEKIPTDIKDGIYYVNDRLAKENPNMESKNILSRNSYNITVSILDFETKKLYIYELDT